MRQYKILKEARPLFLMQQFINLLDEFSYTGFNEIELSTKDNQIELSYMQGDVKSTDWLIEFIYKSEYFSLDQFKIKETVGLFCEEEDIIVSLIVKCKFLKER